MVGDTLACGKALVLIAGSLAASMIYLAAEEPCIFLGAGGSSMWGKGLTCKYNCKGEVLEMQLDPPEDRCPGDDAPENLIEWLTIKWLEIKRVL